MTRFACQLLSTLDAHFCRDNIEKIGVEKNLGWTPIEFDPAQARTNFRKYGVSFAHAKQALLDLMAFIIKDPDFIGEQRFVTLGTYSLGRVLVVIHTQRDERTRLISARKASRGEADQYHA